VVDPYDTVTSSSLSTTQVVVTGTADFVTAFGGELTAAGTAVPGGLIGTRGGVGAMTEVPVLLVPVLLVPVLPVPVLPVEPIVVGYSYVSRDTERVSPSTCRVKSECGCSQRKTIPQTFPAHGPGDCGAGFAAGTDGSRIPYETEPPPIAAEKPN
jgi:hypothetical protein